MRITIAALLFALLLVGSSPTTAQPSCDPYCDYLHDYGPRDLTYLRPGLFCYPRCFLDGTCAPYGYCVSSPPRTGRVTVRSLAVTLTPTTTTYFDPALATIPVVRKRAKPRARR